MYINIAFQEYYILKIEASDLSESTKRKYRYYEKILNRYFACEPSDLSKKRYQEIMNALGRTKGRDTLRRLNRVIIQACDFSDLDIAFTKGFKANSVRTQQLPSKKYITNKSDYERFIKELSDFLEDSDTHVSAMISLTCATTGLRLAEALGLKWEDIDLNAKKIHVKRAYSQDLRRIVSLKTETSNRFVPMPDCLSKVLVKWRWLQGIDSEKNEFIFVSTRYQAGRPSTEAINHFLRRFLMGMLIVPVTTKGLRHSYASYLLAEKVSIYAVSRLLGHATTQSLIRVYGHQFEDDLAKIIAKFDMF